MKRLLATLGPGLLVAATGVGAGDLATASFTGYQLGVAVLWAVALGALFKFILNEGLARYQLATGETVLEGGMRRLGRGARYVFLLYFLPWSFFVGTALMGACGVAAHAVLPVFGDASSGKIVWGLLHSAAGVALVLLGGFKLFEKIMSWCIALMFVTALVTVFMIGPDWGRVAAGLLVPRIPEIGGQGLAWTVALIGGVGGTLTVLCYGYWIREVGRVSESDLKTCRIDLAVGYAATALFGMAMVVIGSKARLSGSGADLLVSLGDSLEPVLGTAGRWAFLLGAWAAVFSSLLGVWQAVPYIFADFANLWRGIEGEVDARSPEYTAYLYCLASIPAIGLFFSFKAMQKAYAVIGAGFLPILALALLILNRPRNGAWSVAGLVATLLFFVGTGILTLLRLL